MTLAVEGGGPPRLQRVSVGGSRSSRRVRPGPEPDLSPGLGSSNPVRRRLRSFPRRRGPQTAGAVGAQHGRILRPTRCCIREAHHRRDREFAGTGDLARPLGIDGPRSEQAI